MPLLRILSTAAQSQKVFVEGAIRLETVKSEAVRSDLNKLVFIAGSKSISLYLCVRVALDWSFGMSQLMSRIASTIGAFGFSSRYGWRSFGDSFFSTWLTALPLQSFSNLPHKSVVFAHVEEVGGVFSE